MKLEGGMCSLDKYKNPGFYHSRRCFFLKFPDADLALVIMGGLGGGGPGGGGLGGMGGSGGGGSIGGSGGTGGLGGSNDFL